MNDDSSTPKPNEKLTTIRFHFYSIRFTPYNDLTIGSNDILNKVITFISNEHLKHKGYIIDRHHNRPNEERRELFMNHAIIMAKEKRIRCSIALLRSGKQPMLKPSDSFDLVPLDKTKGSIAEQTHFFIDYSRIPAVICLEFNYNGPRISDIEFYFRSIAHDRLKLSKATEATLFMDQNIDKTLNNLQNVLNFEMKIQPQKIQQLDTELIGYITGINTMGQKLKPKFIKIEAMFQTPGTKVKSIELNKEANGMILNFLRKFKGRPFNIDCFENFEVKYEDKDGIEDFFNLLKSKKEITKDVDLSVIRNTRQWFEIIEQDFNDFIKGLQ